MEKFTQTNYYKSLKQKEMTTPNEKNRNHPLRTEKIEVEFTATYSEALPIAKFNSKDLKIIHKTEAKGKVVFLTPKVKKYLRDGQMYIFKGSLIDKGSFEMLYANKVSKLVHGGNKVIFNNNNHHHGI